MSRAFKLEAIPLPYTLAVVTYDKDMSERRRRIRTWASIFALLEDKGIAGSYVGSAGLPGAQEIQMTHPWWTSVMTHVDRVMGQ